MRRHPLLSGLLGLCLAAPWTLVASWDSAAMAGAPVHRRPSPAAARAARPRTPVVVELFTAQGCVSCGKANVVVSHLADRPGVLPLTWSVDYWDYLGWKDTFAKPEFAKRQRVFDKRFGVNDVYTPQIVVDGVGQTTGGDPGAIDDLIRKAQRSPIARPAIEWRGEDAVAVGFGLRPRDGAEVWLIRFDPRERDVTVKEGDNRGSVMAARNVVRQLVRLGDWSGRSVKYALPPPPEEGLSTLVIVQGAGGGRILGALLNPAATAAE